MKRIQENYENTLIINKSEFICHLYRVNNVTEVEDILAKVKKKYYDATHNCYAYIIGDNQEIQKASDDGEPSKTAGLPILDVLKKNDLTNILAIVTRYFGGILLGAGGLIRAYSASTASCLKLAKFYVPQIVRHFTLTTTYQAYNTIIKTISYININNTSFTTNVIIDGSIKLDMIEKFKDDLYHYKIDPTSLSIKELITTEILQDI